MQEQLITFKTAKLAKEKGFKESVLYHYWRINGDNSDFEKSPRPNSELIREVDTVMSTDQEKNGCIVSVEMLNRNYLWEDTHPILRECKSFIAVPTQALLQKWIRDMHNLHIEISWELHMKWFYQISKALYTELDSIIVDSYDEGFDSYENCLEAGLYNALQLIK